MKPETLSETQRLDVIERVKSGLIGFTSVLKTWGLTVDDFVVCDEVAFNLVGIPVVGPEIGRVQQGLSPHIDIAINESKYQGPRANVYHPAKIILPIEETYRIVQVYGLAVPDFFLEGFFPGCLTEWVDIGRGISIQVLEPVTNAQLFAENTILKYSLEEQGVDRILDWYKKLKLIYKAALETKRNDLATISQELIGKSEERWGELLGQFEV